MYYPRDECERRYYGGDVSAIALLLTVIFLWFAFRLALLVLNFVVLPALVIMVIIYSLMLLFGFGRGRAYAWSKLAPIIVLGLVLGAVDYYALELDQTVVDGWHWVQATEKAGEAKDSARKAEVESWGVPGSPEYEAHLNAESDRELKARHLGTIESP